MIAAKHITRGLGFVSNIWFFEDEERLVLQGSRTLAAPKWISQDHLDEELAYMSPIDALVYGKIPVTLQNCFTGIFCNPSVGPMQPLSVTFRKFQNIGIYGQNISALQINPWKMMQYRGIAWELFSIIDEGNMKLRLSDGSTLPMSSTSLGSIDVTMWQGEEFLMAESRIGEFGKTLANLMTRKNMTRIYGPQTLKVLGEIGYATKRNPAIIRLE